MPPTAGSPINVTTAAFDRASARGLVLVDFWAAWCGPCRVFAPVFAAGAARHPDVRFLKVDTDAELELARRFQITAIPTLIALRDGREVFRRAGLVHAGGLDAIIEHLSTRAA